MPTRAKILTADRSLVVADNLQEFNCGLQRFRSESVIPFRRPTPCAVVMHLMRSFQATDRELVAAGVAAASSFCDESRMTEIANRFTAAERRIVRRYRTPHQVQQYLNRLPYNAELNGGTLRSFRGVVQKGEAHCLEAALSAAVILEQHRFPTWLLDIASQDGLDHVVFLYQRNDLWGTIGRSRDPGLHGRRPVFADLAELVDSYADPFVDYSGRIIGWGVFDLKTLGSYDWRLANHNVWKVQQALIDMPHQDFDMSQDRYDYWLQRYRKYKQRFPDRKPLYYENRRAWKPGYPRAH